MIPLTTILVQAIRSCQQFARSRGLAAHKLAGLAIVGCCLGCWQEVRYEPTKTAAPSQKVAVVEAETPIQENDPAVTNATPSPEALLGDKPTDQPPVVEEIVPAPVVEQPEPTVIGDPASESPTTETLASETPTTESPTTEPPAILPPQDFDPFSETEAPVDPAPAESGAVETVPVGPAVGDPSAEANSPEVARTALATWRMSSEWSMAAARQAKGGAANDYGEYLEQAKYGARLLGVSLPDLPTHAVGADRLPKNLKFLLEDAGPRLASELNKQYGTDHAALAELATKTHVLLLSYTPNSKRLEPVIAAIRQAAQNSGLPQSVWGELVDLLTVRAEFKKVKAAIFELHPRATAYLSGQK